MCAEGTAKQTYLMDEARCPGIGADTVISLVHHYFEHYGIGEKHAQIQFDNATGQNKNNAVLWYLMWRVLSGLHVSIEVNTMLMLVRHTKFWPDWHFGVLKVKWRNSAAESVQDIANTVQASSKGGHNVLVEDQHKPVQFFKWKNFLGKYFSTVPNVTKYHYSSVNSGTPNIINCKEYADSDIVSVPIRKDVIIPAGQLPEYTPLPGLSAARLWYLFEQIGQFFRSNSTRELFCPRPIVPKVEHVIKSDDEASNKQGL